MADFGFSLHPSSSIDLDNADKRLYKIVSEFEPDIKKCIACGSCTASCSASNLTKVSFRQAILKLDRGLSEEAVMLLKGCMLCGKCTMTCPRGINTRNIINHILRYSDNKKIK